MNLGVSWPLCLGDVCPSGRRTECPDCQFGLTTGSSAKLLTNETSLLSERRPRKVAIEFN